MPVSRLANTWKCLNLFYSYYFREMIFFFFFKKGKGFYFLFFCNASKQGNASCSLCVKNVLTVLLTFLIPKTLTYHPAGLALCML